MIHETEIRIGNWVANIHTDNPYQLTINKMIGLLPHFRENILYVKPILITEEILLECGFEKKEQRFESKETLLRISYFDSAWHCSIGDDDFGFLFRTIKHLHQLQNLYFALTGKELQIEL